MRVHSIACLALVAGCGGTSATLTIHDDLIDPSSALAGCGSGDVADNLAILSDIRESYHEMIVCGGLGLDFDSAIANVIVNVALGGKAPQAMSYKGNGTFESANGMMMIKTSLVGGGAASFDVLDPNSYLVGLTVNANGAINALARGGNWKQMLGRAASSVDLRFQSTGPGAALLGLTANELRGGHLATAPERIAKAIAAHIAVEDRIDVTNTHGDTTVHYVLEGPPLPLAEVLDSHAINMKLASIAATHGNQSIAVSEWTMQFKGDGGKVLDGTIGMDVTGGAFPYHAQFTYAHDMSPNIALRCR